MASLWARRISLVAIWRGWSPHWLEPVLAWRITKADTDPWAFDDLRAFARALLDAGEPFPLMLDEWAREVAAGRKLKRSRTGPKENPRQDLAIAHMFRATRRVEPSQQAALAKIGNELNLSVSGVRNAVRRGRSVSLLGAELKTQTGQE